MLSLIAFHRFLIATGILFCFGFAAWEGRAFLANGAAGELLLAIVFTILGIGLVVYLRRLNQILGYDTRSR